jgi:hypothetical protein
MGYSLAMTDYIPAGGTSANLQTMIVASGPGETSGDVTGHGVAWSIEANGTLAQEQVIYTDLADVADHHESGDFFGAALVVANRTPGVAVTWDSLLLAVGSPGEDGGDRYDRGVAHMFSLVGAPGSHDLPTDTQLQSTGTSWATGEPSSGLSWASGQRIGTSMHATTSHLYIGDPWSAKPRVYAIPWGNLTSGGTAKVVTYSPADFGAADSAVSFGAALA